MVHFSPYCLDIIFCNAGGMNVVCVLCGQKSNNGLLCKDSGLQSYELEHSTDGRRRFLYKFGTIGLIQNKY